MEPFFRIVLLLFFFSLTQIEAIRPPNPELYTGYKCSNTTKCPEDAGFCNEENQCECTLGFFGQKPEKVGGKTVCKSFQCKRTDECHKLYGNNSNCLENYNYQDGHEYFCECIGGTKYSQTERECVIDKVQIGGECSTDKNCTKDGYAKELVGTFCNKETGKCSCQLGQEPHGDWYCKTVVCRTYADCIGSDPKLDCGLSYDYRVGVCKCGDHSNFDNYQQDRNSNPTKCIIPVPGGACKDWGDCPGTLDCKNGKCEKATRNSSNFLSSSFTVFVVFAFFTSYFSIQ